MMYDDIYNELSKCTDMRSLIVRFRELRDGGADVAILNKAMTKAKKDMVTKRSDMIDVKIQKVWIDTKIPDRNTILYPTVVDRIDIPNIKLDDKGVLHV